MTAGANELRLWSETVQQWANRIEDVRTAEQARLFATELGRLARRQEVTDRQHV